MENNQRNSRKRLNSLILLVAFTAVMLIVSTYAWFSAQKNVTISGLKGTVKVAEGLEISLDAENWSQEVDFSKWTDEQLKVMYAVLDKTGTDTYYGESTGIGASRIGGYDLTSSPEHNIVPTELLPVSTTGRAETATDAADADGIGLTDLNMYRGVNTNTKQLSEIITTLKSTDLDTTTVYGTPTAKNDIGSALTAAHHDYPGYYAIDLFLRNSSGSTESGTANRSDILQLNSNSLLKLTNAAANSTGLQNTVRVAFAIYNAAADTGVATDGDDTNTTVDSEEWTAALPEFAKSTYMTAAQQQILNAYKDQTIADIAIWEPNASDHTQTVVSQYNNNSLMTFKTADATLYGITDNKLGLSQAMRTYALTYDATQLTATNGIQIANIYDWNTPASGTAPQVTLQTEKTAADDFKINGGIKNLVSVTSDATKKYVTGEESGVTNFKMAKGTVCKVRMYVWLEGQDVDTINAASHGGGIYLDVGLIKDGDVVS